MRNCKIVLLFLSTRMSKAASEAPPPRPQQVIDLCGDDDDNASRRNEAIVVVAFVPTNHETIDLLSDDDVRGLPLRRQQRQHSKEKEREKVSDAFPGMKRRARKMTGKVAPSATAASSVEFAPGVVDLEQPEAAVAAATMQATPTRTRKLTHKVAPSAATASSVEWAPGVVDLEQPDAAVAAAMMLAAPTRTRKTTRKVAPSAAAASSVEFAPGVVDLEQSEAAFAAATMQATPTRKRKMTRKVAPSAAAASSVEWAPGVVDLEQPEAAVAAAMMPEAPTRTPLEIVTRTPLEMVTDIFPDVHPNHAQMLIRQHGNPLMVASILAESQYPKSKTTLPAPRVDDDVHFHHSKRKREYQFDFMSSSSFAPTPDYTAQAQAQICQDFPFIAVTRCGEVLREIGKGHYAICYDEICKRVMGGSLSQDGDKQVDQYHLLRSAVSGIPLSKQQHQRLMCGQQRLTVWQPRQVPKVAAILNQILIEEISYVKQKESEWTEEVNMRLARKDSRAAAEKAGATIECPCCCVDVALEEMIACREEGHLFCVDCLRRFAENQIFSMGSFGVDRKTKKPATDLLCMHSDGCSSGFDITHLRKALPDKIMAKYNELQYQAAVDAAGIELFSCPKCGIQAELPSTQMIFKCPDVDCALETCRKCLEPAHIPLKCSEVKKDETEGRLKVEEAITAAKIRACPKLGCGTKYVKSDGCNKMTCPKCQTWSCYICRALVTKSVGYKHFCQTPHCQHVKCSGCPLHSKVEEDDTRAMREAGLQAAEEVRGQSLLTGAHAEVRVDVESILREVVVPRRGR